MRYRRGPEVSRREFGALGLGAGLTALIPAHAGSVDTTGADVLITTPAGTCDAYFVHPSKGRHPAVLMWPDIFGLRAAFKQMATRLAGAGYSVLVVNPFYRLEKAPTSPEHADFSNPTVRKLLTDEMNSLTPEVVTADAKSFIGWLDHQRSVDRKKKMAVTGYCMGGPFTIRTAAEFPDRVGAIASFHGANLVTDAPDSPHLLVSKMKAQALIAIAASDDAKQPDAKDKLRAAFEAAHLPADVEVYAGTMHGWCAIDSRVYNHEQAEKAWSKMLVLFRRTLA
ncbi:MAG TPA: dienelactone hydrolase family protein [Steroidobacteraceae bacterium]|nr:dienelactone hydrolase family protein [Steroidobacteraceae bacterium]